MKYNLFPIALLSAVTVITSPAQAETFSGPYIGATAGWDRSEIADRTIDSQRVDSESSRDALVLGGYAGYNYKIAEKFVIGAEAGFAATVDDKVRTISSGQPLTIDPRYSFDLGARVGYLVTEKALVYARGGYASNRVRTTLETAGGSVRQSNNLDGWQVGGGIEYAFTDRISARAEYRYSDFGRNGGQYDRHQTLVGISYNF